MYNAHVLKWIRFQHYMAVQESRHLATIVWATEYIKEQQRNG
jgi:hypothetical protein